jgi:uncharacterized protein YdeI (YjbR/CyaY-like superfamily)
MRTNGTVEDWYRDCREWADEVAALRGIVLAAGLGETLKWGQLLQGKGPTDCVCGLSRHPPRCDGSHRKRQG